MYHLQQIIAEETELSYTENHVQTPFLYADDANNVSLSSVVSYDWHPQEECHLLCFNSYGMISDFWVNERLCAQWASDGGRLLTSFGKLIAELKHFHLNEETTPLGEKEDESQQQDEDISTVMQRRALLGYGIIGDSGASDDSRSLKQNADLCLTDGGANSTALYWTWMWMDKLKLMGDCEPSENWSYDTRLKFFKNLFTFIVYNFLISAFLAYSTSSAWVLVRKAELPISNIDRWLVWTLPRVIRRCFGYVLFNF